MIDLLRIYKMRWIEEDEKRRMSVMIVINILITAMLVGRSVGLLVGRLVGRFVVLLDGRLVGRFVVLLDGRLVG